MVKLFFTESTQNISNSTVENIAQLSESYGLNKKIDLPSKNLERQSLSVDKPVNLLQHSSAITDSRDQKTDL